MKLEQHKPTQICNGCSDKAVQAADCGDGPSQSTCCSSSSSNNTTTSSHCCQCAAAASDAAATATLRESAVVSTAFLQTSVLH